MIEELASETCIRSYMKPVATLAILTVLTPAEAAPAMPAWAHGEWRLLHAHVSRGADSGPEGRAMPEQRDAERHQLLP